MSYQIASDKVAHQVIDGEVIAIHYDTGFYFSFLGAAADLWQMLVEPQTIDTLCARFGTVNDDVRDTVRRFVGHLVSEKLVLTSTRPPSSSAPEGCQGVPTGDLDFKKYDDLRAIFLADPIHDVGEEGWPELKAQE